MTNYAFRYIDEVPLIAEEQIDRLHQILTLPLNEAEALTVDELDEDTIEALAA